jgi:hypothetical protein
VVEILMSIFCSGWKSYFLRGVKQTSESIFKSENKFKTSILMNFTLRKISGSDQ